MRTAIVEAKFQFVVNEPPKGMTEEQFKAAIFEAFNNMIMIRPKLMVEQINISYETVPNLGISRPGTGGDN